MMKKDDIVDGAKTISYSRVNFLLRFFPLSMLSSYLLMMGQSLLSQMMMMIEFI